MPACNGMVAKKTERENAQCDLACIEREQYSVHARNLYTGYVLSGSLLSLLLTGVPKHYQTLTIMILSANGTTWKPQLPAV